jgi:hypothetical protein
MMSMVDVFISEPPVLCREGGEKKSIRSVNSGCLSMQLYGGLESRYFILHLIVGKSRLALLADLIFRFFQFDLVHDLDAGPFTERTCSASAFYLVANTAASVGF